MRNGGLHRRGHESAATRLRQYQPAPSALASLFVIMSLCAAVTILRLSLASPSAGSIEHWTFRAGEVSIANALDGFDVIRHGGNESPLSLTSRGLTLGASTAVNSATYFQRHMPGTVNRIGVTANFEVARPGVAGQVALLVSSAPMPTDAADFDNGIPDMGIHFVFDSDMWLMSVWRHDGGQDVLGTGRFTTPLVGDRSVEIIRRGDEVTISLPNGESPKFTDYRIGKWSDSWATWELYEKSPGITPAVIRQIWAGWER